MKKKTNELSLLPITLSASANQLPALARGDWLVNIIKFINKI
jgi:hypothetical protein